MKTHPAPALLFLAALAAVMFLAPQSAQCLEAASQPVAFMNEEGFYGFRAADGSVLLEPQYRLAGDFSAHGIAEVVDDEGWAIIDTSGDVLLRPFVFDNGPDPFSDGLARFVENGKYGFFNEKGEVAIPARFDFAAPFYDGRAAFCQGCEKVHYGEHWSMEGGLWGCIDRQGKVVLEPAPKARNCSAF